MEAARSHTRTLASSGGQELQAAPATVADAIVVESWQRQCGPTTCGVRSLLIASGHVGDGRAEEALLEDVGAGPAAPSERVARDKIMACGMVLDELVALASDLPGRFLAAAACERGATKQPRALHCGTPALADEDALRSTLLAALESAGGVPGSLVLRHGRRGRRSEDRRAFATRLLLFHQVETVIGWAVEAGLPAATPAATAAAAVAPVAIEDAAERIGCRASKRASLLGEGVCPGAGRRKGIHRCGRGSK